MSTNFVLLVIALSAVLPWVFPSVFCPKPQK
jgi:hypothetical protein